MIVVLEGPDFAGKSTAAERLSVLFDAEVHWVGQPPMSAELVSYYLDPISAAASQGGLVVFDRLHISELVYGPLFRGGSRLSASQAAEIEAVLDAVGVLKVHVDVEDALLVQRFRGPRGDELVDDERLLIEVAHSYRRLLSDPGILERWQTMSLDVLVATVQSRIAEPGRRSRPAPGR